MDSSNIFCVANGVCLTSIQGVFAKISYMILARKEMEVVKFWCGEDVLVEVDEIFYLSSHSSIHCSNIRERVGEET